MLPLAPRSRLVNMIQTRIDIKGTSHGLVIRIGPGDWSGLFNELASRLEQTPSFFKGGRVALDVGPRQLTQGQLMHVGDLLQTHKMSLWAVISEAEETREQAASLGLGGAVQFAGFREDLDGLVGCFDLFVHPASAEGLGVAVMKASAAGLAVVACDAGGVSEVVADGSTGLLVPPDDAEALGEAIARLIDDQPLRESFGAAGRERMQNEFSIATMVEAYLALYDSLLAE